MNVKVIIDGMMCIKCSGRVERAFNAVEGIEASVSLEDKTALLKLSKDYTDEELTAIVTEAGYKVVQIIR